MLRGRARGDKVLFRTTFETPQSVAAQRITLVGAPAVDEGITFNGSSQYATFTPPLLGGWGDGFFLVAGGEHLVISVGAGQVAEGLELIVGEVVVDQDFHGVSSGQTGGSRWSNQAKWASMASISSSREWLRRGP